MNKLIIYLATRLLFLWNNLKRRESSLDFRKLNSVLFIETSRMGDVVAMLPLLQSFNSSNPHINIYVAVDAWYSDVLKGIPFISSIISLEETKTARGFNKARKILKNIKVNFAVSVSPSYRNALLTLFTKSKFKIGYFGCKTSTTPFLFESKITAVGFKLRTQTKYFMENIIERSIKIARALEIPIAIKYPDYLIPDTLQNRVKSDSTDLEIPRDKYIVIHPFSGWKYRSWDLNNYFIIAERLSSKGFSVIMIGSIEEREKIKSILEQKRSNIKFLFGEPLLKLIQVIKRASLFLGNDSGPLHLATLLGVPCIGLFGPATPKLTAPISEKNIYIYKQTDCSPCKQVECIRPQNPCMSLLSVDEVMDTVNKSLNKLGLIDGN